MTAVLTDIPAEPFQQLFRERLGPFWLVLLFLLSLVWEPPQQVSEPAPRIRLGAPRLVALDPAAVRQVSSLMGALAADAMAELCEGLA